MNLMHHDCEFTIFDYKAEVVDKEISTVTELQARQDNILNQRIKYGTPVQPIRFLNWYAVGIPEGEEIVHILMFRIFF